MTMPRGETTADERSRSSTPPITSDWPMNTTRTRGSERTRTRTGPRRGPTSFRSPRSRTTRRCADMSTTRASGMQAVPGQLRCFNQVRARDAQQGLGPPGCAPAPVIPVQGGWRRRGREPGRRRIIPGDQAGRRRRRRRRAKEERRRQPASNSPSPTRNAREPGEVGDLARDKTASAVAGKGRDLPGRARKAPKVRSPTRDENSPRSPKVGEHAQFG